MCKRLCEHDLPLRRLKEIQARELPLGKQSEQLGIDLRAYGFHQITGPDHLLHKGASPLIAPYSTDSTTWLDLPWIDIRSEEVVRITTETAAAAISANGLIAVQTLGSYFQSFRTKPVWELLSPTGKRGKDASGMLAHRPVRRSGTVLIGKETASLLELSQAGLLEHESSHLEFASSWFDAFRSVLADIPRKELRERLGVDPSTIRRWISGKCQPSEDLRYAIERICYEFVVRTLEPLGIQVPNHPASATVLYRSVVQRSKVAE